MSQPRIEAARRSNALIGGTLIGALLVVAGIGAFWTPYDPLRHLLRAYKLAPPSEMFWLGTDEFGRDVLVAADGAARRPSASGSASSPLRWRSCSAR